MYFALHVYDQAFGKAFDDFTYDAEKEVYYVEGANVEEIDKNRTQLYVYNCNSGFGTEWIAGVKARYEELHKNDVYEEGKKGIQIIINNEKKKTKF